MRSRLHLAALEWVCDAGSRLLHQLRRAHAVEMSREGVLLLVIQRQLGHYADLAITSVYLRGIDNREIVQAVLARPRTRRPYPAVDDRAH